MPDPPFRPPKMCTSEPLNLRHLPRIYGNSGKMQSRKAPETRWFPGCDFQPPDAGRTKEPSGKRLPVCPELRCPFVRLILARRAQGRSGRGAAVFWELSRFSRRDHRGLKSPATQNENRLRRVAPRTHFSGFSLGMGGSSPTPRNCGLTPDCDFSLAMKRSFA